MAKCCICECDEELIEEIENDSIVYFCPNCGSKYDSLGELIGSEKIISKEENTISETKKIVDEKVKAPEVVVNKKVETPLQMKQYKVISTKDGWFTNEFSTTKLEVILNRYASQGWVVKSCVTAEVPALFSTTREEIVIILEKDL